MGNFYSNIVLREADLDRVASALARLNRRAYVAGDGTTSFVFDERCDDQDLEEIERLAQQLSRNLGCVALASCNHDDDILWYALVDGGKTVDTYDSNPGYFSGASAVPKGGDASLLCEAFGARGRERDVSSVLRRTRPELTFEVDRHRDLLELLGLRVELGLLGFRYASEGVDSEGGITLRPIGGAAEPVVREASRPQPTIDAETRARLQAEAASMASHMTALVLARIRVLPRFVEIVGGESVNGYIAVMRVQEYIVRHKLQSSPGIVRADDLLAELLGEREFPMLSLVRLVARAFDVKPLTPEETASLSVKNSEMQRRYQEAMISVAAELM